MKRSFYALGLMLAATFTLTNCAKEIDAPVQEPSDAGIPFEIIANAVDTKTTNDGVSTVWADGDALNVFHAEAGTTAYGKDGEFTYGVTENGNFAGTLASGLDADKTYDWYASYPYSSYVKTPASTSSGYMTVASSASGSQTQTGNNSMAHIAGANYPLYGVATGVAASETPAITMNHLTSLIEVNVYNEVGEDIVVSNVSFTAPESVVGTYYIDFTGTAPAFVSSGDSYVSSTASLNVVDGEAIVSDEDPAKFYLAVKPFTAAAGKAMTVKVTTSDGKYMEFTKTYDADVVFKPGKIKKINVYVASLNEPAATPEYSLSYEETFAESLGDFVAEGEIPTGLSYVWAYDSQYTCAKASAYLYSTPYAQESYLVSPILNLEDVTNAKMSFDHAGSHFGTKTTEATLWIRPVDGNWEQLTIPTYFSGWTFVNSGEIDLSAYTGQKIQIGFKYISTDSNAGTWEIKNLLVEEGTLTPIISNVSTPATVASEGADVTVTYSITNPVTGVELTASTEAEWITNIDCSVSGEVSFTVAANEGDARNASVIFSYAGAESVTVIVSQLAVGGATEVAHELSFADVANRTSFTTSQQVWEQNGVVLTNDKGSSTSNVADYSNPARFYKSSKLTIAMSDETPMTKIEFTCNSTSYATALNNSITAAEGVTVSVSSTVVTVVFSEPQTSYVIASLTGGQVRMNSLTVYTNN